MGTVAEKLTYLGETKEELKDTINYATEDEITSQTTFREYPRKLYKSFIEIINHGTEALFESLPKVTGSGSDITLNNTEECKMKSVPLGNLSQESTSGKQLFNVSEIVPVSGESIDEDGWITVSGNNASGSGDMYKNLFTSNLDVETSTNYLIVLEVKNVSGTGTLQVTDGHTNSQFITSFSKVFASLSNNTKYSGIVATKSSFETSTFGLRSYAYFHPGENGTITFRLSVLADTTITTDTFVYEPFTGGQPAPSPDYPQDIKVVTGDNTVKVQNKNLCESFYVSPELRQWQRILFSKFDIKPNTTYTFSFETNQSGDVFYTNENIFTSSSTITVSSSGRNYFTRTTRSKEELDALSSGDNTENGYAILKSKVALSIVSTFSDLQIEKGLTATDYVPHQDQTQLLSLGVENKFDSSILNDLSFEGLTVTYYDDGTIELDGTYTGSSTTAVNHDINSPINTNGIMSMNVISGSCTGTSVTNTIRFNLFDSNQSWYNRWAAIEGGDTNYSILTDAYNFNKANLAIYPNSTFNKLRIGLQVEEGTVAHSYSPYGQTPIELCKIGNYIDLPRRSTGKNLLPYPYDETTKTLNGITFTDLGNGMIKVNGTATANSAFYLLPDSNIPESLKTTITINASQTSGIVIQGVFDDTTANFYANNTLKNIDLTNANTGYIRIQIPSGTTINNAIVNPFVVSGTYTTATLPNPEPYGEGVWYVHKEIGKVVLDGSEDSWASFQVESSGLGRAIVSWNNVLYNSSLKTVMSNKLVGTKYSSSWNNTYECIASMNSNRFIVYLKDVSNMDEFKTKISSEYEVIFVLATPTYETITSETLIEQLNNLEDIYSYNGQTNVSVESGSENAQMELDTEAIAQYE